MKLFEKVRIAAPPESVWSYVGDPEQWPGFHPNVGRVVRRSGSGPVVGSWYDIDYRMRDRAFVHHARVVACEPLRLLVLEATCSGEQAGRTREVGVTIRYSLHEVRGGVEVRETFTIVGHGMPWFVVLLFALIRRFGRPVDPSGLQLLKQALESGVPATETA